MNIVKENVEGLNEVLKVTVEQSDYQDRVAKALNDYRKKAKIDGFRPGIDRKSTRLNSSHAIPSRMPSSA